MKRKPIEIVADVINSLNGLQMNQQYSINELKSRSNIHWETASNYLQLIQFIQDYAPKIEMDPETKNFQICAYSNVTQNLPLEEQLILYLFLNKAFSNESMISERELWENLPPDQLRTIENSKYLEMAKFNNENIFMLTRKGKFKAQSILANINRSMAYSIDNCGKKLIPKSENMVLIPFQKNNEIEKLRKIPTPEKPSFERDLQSKSLSSYDHLFCSMQNESEELTNSQNFNIYPTSRNIRSISNSNFA